MGSVTLVWSYNSHNTTALTTPAWAGFQQYLESGAVCVSFTCYNEQFGGFGITVNVLNNRSAPRALYNRVTFSTRTSNVLMHSAVLAGAKQ